MTGGMSVTEDISTGDPGRSAVDPRAGRRRRRLGRGAARRLRDLRQPCRRRLRSFSRSGRVRRGVYANIVDMRALRRQRQHGARRRRGRRRRVLGRRRGSASSSVSTSPSPRSPATESAACSPTAAASTPMAAASAIARPSKSATRRSRRTWSSRAPGLPPFVLAIGYWRGGGVYMSNGYLAHAGLHRRGERGLRRPAHGHARASPTWRAASRRRSATPTRSKT